MTDEPYPPLRPQPRAGRRSSTAWPLVIGVVVLAVLAVIAALLVLNENDPPAGAGSPTPTSAPSSVASESADASASAPAGETTAPSQGGARFALDDVVETAVDGLALRDGPGLDAHLDWRLRMGTKGIVIGGPTDADGHVWYQLSGMGLPYGSGCVTPEEGELLDCPAYLGWVAGTDTDGSPWLTASTPDECPTAPPDVEVLAALPFTMRLLCYGNDELTFVAFWPELPDDGFGGACDGDDADIGWLVCQNVNTTVLSAGETGASFAVNVDPSSGVAMPDRGQWVEVSGHFDDPAAQECDAAAEARDEDPNALVFGCRWQFVLSSVTITTAPTE